MIMIFFRVYFIAGEMLNWRDERTRTPAHPWWVILDRTDSPILKENV
jgi:hypothetical protein